MGRRQQTEPPVPATYIRECFHVRDGALVWRERPASHFPERPDDVTRFNNLRASEPAGFRGPNGEPLVRFVYDGKPRRMAMLRVAWIVATGELPCGAVKPRDGDQWNASPQNLILTKRGPRPYDQGKGGKASSLVRRAKTTTTLINALADHPGSTVPMLSKLVGSSAPCVCTRLGKLADMGLTCGPKCDARARWDLTQAGKALAMNGQPLLDDLDRSILRALALAPKRAIALKLRLEACSLTIKRRTGLLIERGLIEAQDGGFRITDQGRAALGRPVSEAMANPCRHIRRDGERRAATARTPQRNVRRRAHAD